MDRRAIIRNVIFTLFFAFKLFGGQGNVFPPIGGSGGSGGPWTNNGAAILLSSNVVFPVQIPTTIDTPTTGTAIDVANRLLYPVSNLSFTNLDWSRPGDVRTLHLTASAITNTSLSPNQLVGSDANGQEVSVNEITQIIQVSGKATFNQIIATNFVDVTNPVTSFDVFVTNGTITVTHSNNIDANIVYALDATNKSAASANHIRNSPFIRQTGNGDENGGQGPISFQYGVVPISTLANNALGVWRINSATNLHSYAHNLDFASNGNLTNAQSIAFGFDNGFGPASFSQGGSQILSQSGNSAIAWMFNGSEPMEIQTGGGVRYDFWSTKLVPGTDNAIWLGKGAQSGLRFAGVVTGPGGITNDINGWGNGGSVTTPNGGNAANTAAAANLKVIGPFGVGTGPSGDIEFWTGGTGASGSTSSSGTNRVTIKAQTGLLVCSNGIASWKNNAAGPTSISVTASPFTFTAPASGNNIQVFLDANGSTTAVTFNGTAIFASLASGDHSIIMQPNDSIVVTYSVATPVMSYREL